MADIKSFILPDLGEGLPDAEIVEWHVKVGDKVKLDQPLVSMETAKAVVDVPSPYTGTVVKLFGKAGDVIDTGAPLASFELDASAAQRAEAEPTGHHHAPPPKSGASGGGAGAPSGAGASKGAGRPVPDEASRDDGDATTVIASDEGGEILEDAAPPPSTKGTPGRADSGTVVGAMEASDRVAGDQATMVGGVKAMPAVRALAKKLGVELARVAATGAGGVLTMADVKQAAERGDAQVGVASSARSVGGPPSTQPLSRPARDGHGVASSGGTGAAPHFAPLPQGGRGDDRMRSSGGEGRHAGAASAGEARTVAGKPMRTVPHTVQATGQPEQLKGVRRNMARIMADSHAKVVPTTIVDDADIHAWQPGNDIMARLVRALVAGAKAVPALNAWFDGDAGTLTLHQRVDVGIAVDTDDGLFVPALRNADMLDGKGVRTAINRIRDQVRDRTIPADELKGYTVMLSNFGMFAGKYATPVIVPPCVAIVAAGRLHHQVVPVMGGIESHRVIPLSVTFDHRAATGGEAAKFLRAMLDDLALTH